jgi:outer membrane protein TolC
MPCTKPSPVLSKLPARARAGLLALVLLPPCFFFLESQEVFAQKLAQSSKAKNKQLPLVIPTMSPQPPGKVPGMSSLQEEEMPKLRGISDENENKLKTLDDLAKEVSKSSGSIFVDAENVLVKPPLLQSLITITDTTNPYELDAQASKEISLRSVLQDSLAQNLPIKISQAQTQKEKWAYYGALSGFLPSLTNALGYQGIKGNYVSPAGLAIPISNPYFSTTAGFTQYLFKGGAILYTAKQDKHNYQAAKAQLGGTVNDILLDTADRYYELVRSDVLLQIRIKAVEVSKALLTVNQDLFDNGVNTQLDVLQAKYQLSADRQHLIKQQVERRKQAVKLSAVLNADTGTDLTVGSRLISKHRLLDKSLKPADLLAMAIEKRPELKKHDELRLAAKDAIKVARASLMPSVAVSGSVIGTGSRAVNSNQLSNQQTSLSSSSLSVGSVSSSAGLPLAAPPSNSGNPHYTTRSLFVIGVGLEWNLGGLGIQQVSQVRQAQYQARQAQLEFLKTLERVTKEVRDAYLSSISAENLIIETTDAVKYAEEGLRLAELRFQEGVGTYLDVINAQHDYTNSLIDKANALIDFNSAQVRLVHAVGMPSVDTLTAAIPLKGTR